MGSSQSFPRSFKVICVSCEKEFIVREDLLVRLGDDKWEAKCSNRKCTMPRMIFHRYPFYEPGRPEIDANLDSKRYAPAARCA